MDFLTLCQRARQEAGITGEGPSTVLNQTGQLERLVGWVNQAWTDIQQMRPNWTFMHAEFTFNTVADQRDYVAADVLITDLKLWDTKSFLIHDPAIGYEDQAEMIYLDYGRWRSQYRNQMEARATDKPQLFTVLPNNSIRFEPKPDGVYTIEGEYKRSTQVFADNTDAPTNLPDDFHMMIVWQALKYYGHYENAPEVLEEAEVNFDTLLHRAEIDLLPAFSEDYEALA